MIQSDTLYKDVAGLSEVTTDIVVPNGEIWLIHKFTGAASSHDDTAVCVIWDPAGVNEIVTCTHGDATHDINKKVTGDGVKVIRLRLTNDTSSARIIGGSWEAKVL